VSADAIARQIVMTVAQRRRTSYGKAFAAAASLLFLLDSEVADGATVTVTAQDGTHRVVSLDRLFDFEADQ
jgi:hypothetical protein